MLKPEQVAEIERLLVFECSKSDYYAALQAILHDRAEIRQELETAYNRRREPGYSLTKALTALIERLK